MVLRWLVQRGVAVIPKSVRRERMAENLDVLGLDPLVRALGARRVE